MIDADRINFFMFDSVVSRVEMLCAAENDINAIIIQWDLNIVLAIGIWQHVELNR